VIYLCLEETIRFHVIYICTHLKVIKEVLWVFVSSSMYPQAGFTFLSGKSVAGLGSQRVKNRNLTCFILLQLHELRHLNDQIRFFLSTGSSV
jgi:hypothetical protein